MPTSKLNFNAINKRTTFKMEDAECFLNIKKAV